MTARAKVCFQTVPEDGRAMAHFFPEPEGEIKPEDIDAQVSKTLLIRGSDYGPVVERFVDGYLAPLQGYRHGRQVEIANGGFDMRAIAMHGALNVENQPPPLVDDPTPYLDRLLYNVMRTGDYNLSPIPWEIPLGFSNSGGGFFAAARGAKEAELSATIAPLKGFPAHLLVPTADGDVEWTRQPRMGKEWFWHFMFSLRSLMYQLAHDPIGKVTESSTSEIAKMLSSLPRRAAFVRGGDDVGVIYTHNTPQRVTQTDYAARLQAIYGQTRAKYCHPRDDVERAMLAAAEAGGSGQPSSPGQPANPDALLGGWEEF